MFSVATSYQMAYVLKERIWVEERHNCARAKGTSFGISSTSSRDQEDLTRMRNAKQPQIIRLGHFCWT